LKKKVKKNWSHELKCVSPVTIMKTQGAKLRGKLSNILQHWHGRLETYPLSYATRSLLLG